MLSSGDAEEAEEKEKGNQGPESYAEDREILVGDLWDGHYCCFFNGLGYVRGGGVGEDREQGGWEDKEHGFRLRDCIDVVVVQIHIFPFSYLSSNSSLPSPIL